jgi:hypothetical protein
MIEPLPDRWLSSMRCACGFLVTARSQESAVESYNEHRAATGHNRLAAACAGPVGDEGHRWVPPIAEAV